MRMSPVLNVCGMRGKSKGSGPAESMESFRGAELENAVGRRAIRLCWGKL